MTNNEAIEIIAHFDKHIIPCDEYGYRIDSDLMEAHLMAAKALRNGWIPVSERLPEVGAGDVLVARLYRGKPYVDIGEFIGGTACCWGDEYAINPREHITTHWMPLPEPPKEDV